MIVLDLSILNQKGTPMFNSDTFANRPSFGIVGRIFISTDTAAIYRDTGTAWDLIADGASSSTNIYNSNGTLSANRVVSDGGFGLSFTPTTHIGTAAIGGGGSGKLIVGSSTADNGIQIFGANSPSLRIDNAQSGGTQRFVFGLATATNNFIQGATAGEFCISTQSAGNMLFGMWQTTNASEVMRITTANNLLINGNVDGGQRLQVYGDAFIKGSGFGSASALSIQDNGGTNLFRFRNDGLFAIGNNANRPFIFPFSTGSGSPNTSGTNLSFYNYTSTESAQQGLWCFENADAKQTSGVNIFLRLSSNFTPTSGTSTFALLFIQNTINQTGGANGITRGLYVNPTLTAAADWRSIEWSNNTGFGLYGAGTANNYLAGSLGIGTNTPSRKLHLVGASALFQNAGDFEFDLLNTSSGNFLRLTAGTSDTTIGTIQNVALSFVMNGTRYGRFTSTNGNLILQNGGTFTDSGERFQLTGSIRVNGQLSGSAGGSSGQHLIINCDGTTYKIKLENV